jgi:membrane protease YdiL (CAAX protease family)
MTTRTARRPEALTSGRRFAAVTGAVLFLATTNVLANRILPGWAYPVCGAVAALALVLLARRAGLPLATLGLARSHLRRSALVGLTGFALVLTTFGIALAVPGLRPLFHDGRMGAPDLPQLLWLALVRIPLGTVLLEEVAFRGVLPALLGAGEHWRWGPVLGASGLFGLWHLLPSLALGQNAAVHAAFGGLPRPVLSLLAMVAAAAAGVFLSWWRHTGRGLLASVLVHLATNSGGLVLAWLFVVR